MKSYGTCQRCKQNFKERESPKFICLRSGNVLKGLQCKDLRLMAAMKRQRGREPFRQRPRQQKTIAAEAKEESKEEAKSLRPEKAPEDYPVLGCGSPHDADPLNAGACLAWRSIQMLR